MLNLYKYNSMIEEGIYGDKEKAVAAAKELIFQIRGEELNNLYGNVENFDGHEIWPDDCDFKFVIKTKVIDLSPTDCIELITGLTVVRA